MLLSSRDFFFIYRTKKSFSVGLNTLIVFSFSCLADLSNSDSLPSSIHPLTYSDCFVEALVLEALKDKDIVAVHAGMQMEPSLQLFQEKFPDKFFDMGIAEQHAVTFSAGLSCGGLKPFCIIPSTFLQRAYDQVPPPLPSPSLSLSLSKLYHMAPLVSHKISCGENVFSEVICVVASFGCLALTCKCILIFLVLFRWSMM